MRSALSYIHSTIHHRIGCITTKQHILHLYTPHTQHTLTQIYPVQLARLYAMDIDYITSLFQI